MLKKTTSLIWLLATLSAIFISCKKEDLTVGSTFQDEDGTFSFTTLTEEDLDLSYATLLQKQDLTTLNEGNVMIGAQSSNQVSNVVVNSFLELDLSSDNFDFGTDPVCDSVILFLNYVDNVPANRYVQGTGVTEVVVRELLEDLISDSAYVSSQGFNFDSEILGSHIFNGGENSNGTQVSLSTTFGNRLISLANNRSSSEFREDFKGLALLSGDASTMISSVNPLDDNTRIKVYFSNAEESSEYDFQLGENGLVEHIQVLSTPTGSFSGLVAEDDIVESTATGNETALVSGAGLHTLIRLNSLVDAIDSLENAVVNKAVFTFNVNPSLYTDITGEAPLLFELIVADENGEPILDSTGNKQVIVPHLNIISGGGTGLFVLDKEERSYTVDITSYLQSVVLNEVSVNSLLLSTDVNISNASYNARFRETTLAVEDIKFEFTYSKL